MLSRHYAAEGRFTFTSHSAGEHTICIGTNSTRWFGGNRLVCVAMVQFIVLMHVPNICHGLESLFLCM